MMIPRRDFLLGSVASGTVPPVAAPLTATRVSGQQQQSTAGDAVDSADRKRGLAVALGGGAAKGFGHVPVLEVFDELGLVPSQIAGTSMGAILGGLYAAGMSGLEIRDYVIDLFARRRPLLRKLFLDSGRPLSSLLNLTRPAMIDPIVLFEAVLPAGLPTSFADLKIPLRIVATNFHGQNQVVLEEGPLLPAIAASSALPVLLTPVRVEGKVLIDGGFTNPTPFDVLDATRFLTIGVDVTGSDFIDTGKLPGALETWIGSFSITLHSLVSEKLRRKAPDLLIEPRVGAFQTMDFFKIEDILNSVDTDRDNLKRQIAALADQM